MDYKPGEYYDACDDYIPESTNFKASTSTSTSTARLNLLATPTASRMAA